MRRRSCYPALEAWRSEVGLGHRTTTSLDALWRAACCEANAQEFSDIPDLHDDFMSDARRIVEEALRSEREGQL